jgi:hypothetical protein
VQEDAVALEALDILLLLRAGDDADVSARVAFRYGRDHLKRIPPLGSAALVLCGDPACASNPQTT